MSPTADVLRPRPPRGMGEGALLALVVHAGLIAALALGVQWRTSTPVGIEAELWAAVPQLAAPAPAPVPPQPVEPTPAPPPPPRVEPKVEAPPDPQIAIEREKRERTEKERRKEEAERKAEAERQAREKAEKAELAAKAKREDAKLAAQREDNLRRMQSLAGDAKPSTGDAERTAGPSASYAGRIRARIQPNIVFTDNPTGNPLATVEVRASADGTIIGRRLVKGSGVAAWDEAVLRAVDKTELLPRDTDGRVPSPIVIDFRPRE